MPRTSNKAQLIVDYVNQFIQENGYSPSVREIGAAVGLRSTASVSYHLHALQEKGLYHFFLAYIKFDYYHAKMLRTVPGYEAELDRARTLGVTDQEIKELFALLRTPRPGTF